MNNDPDPAPVRNDPMSNPSTEVIRAREVLAAIMKRDGLDSQAVEVLSGHWDHTGYIEAMLAFATSSPTVDRDQFLTQPEATQAMYDAATAAIGREGPWRVVWSAMYEAFAADRAMLAFATPDQPAQAVDAGDVDVQALAALPPVGKNQARAFRKCTTHGQVGWYDYTPYSLSVPIAVMPCGCGRESMIDISEEEFHAASGVPQVPVESLDVASFNAGWDACERLWHARVRHPDERRAAAAALANSAHQGTGEASA
jgi:hypothetical protein